MTFFTWENWNKRRDNTLYFSDDFGNLWEARLVQAKRGPRRRPRSIENNFYRYFKNGKEMFARKCGRGKPLGMVSRTIEGLLQAQSGQITNLDEFFS